MSDTIEAQTALILVNSTLFVFKPGPRNYDRTWIRDGSAQALALLCAGLIEEAKRYVVWYSKRIYENGMVPPILNVDGTVNRGYGSDIEFDAQGEFVGIEEFRPFSRVLRLKSPAGLSPQNSVSRTKRWRGRSRGVTVAKLSAEERFAVSGYLPTRRREHRMQRFKSARSAQKFLSTHAAVYNTFNVQRHLMSARSHRVLRTAAMTWREVVAAA